MTLAAGGCSILREDRDVQFGREEGEELPDVVGIQFTGMSLAVVHDEAPDPVDVGFLSQDTEMAHPTGAPDLFEESGGTT